MNRSYTDTREDYSPLFTVVLREETLQGQNTSSPTFVKGGSVKRRSSTFREPLMFLDTFDLLTVDFLLYCLNDGVRRLIRLLNSVSCFAVMPAFTKAVLFQALVEKTSYVYEASNGPS